MIKVWIAIATFFGLGYSPIAPGTVGTLGGVAIYLLFHFMNLGWVTYSLFFILLCVLGVIASSHAETHFGVKDPPAVVIDEVLGFLVAMFLIPFSWKILVIGFIINRILDIYKPFPAKQTQNLPGGWGIVLDDLVTSAYTNIILRFVYSIACS